MNMEDHHPITAEELTELLLFQGESPDAIEWLLDTCDRVFLQRDDVLLKPGQKNGTLYLLLNGSVRVQLEENAPALTVLTSGHCVGEMSILDHNNTSAYVIANEPCELMAISGDYLWQLIAQSHAVAANLLTILSARVRNDNQVIGHSHQLQNLYEHRAKIDALTGLYNRRWLNETLSRLISRCNLDHSALSLLMLDVDHFKHYNDNHGHLAGDRALCTLSSSIQANLRPNDVAARFGGEEFVVLLPETSLNEAHAIAERLRHSVREADIQQASGLPLPGITISIGIASLEPGMTEQALIAMADVALYRAKQGGRDRVCE